MNVPKRAGRDLSVGVVLTLAALIFGVGLFAIGSESRLWSRKVTYRIRVPNTNGLQVGSPVRLVGVQVGTVTEVVLPEDPERSDIDIVFKVDHAVESRIRRDTTATLKVLSLLGGDKFLDLTPGSAREPLLDPGSYIQVPEGMGMEEFQALGASIADDLQGITKGLKVILEQLQDRQTFMGQALFDPNFGKETIASLKESVTTTNSILGKVDRGQGLAGRLLTDKQLADTTVARVESSLDRIEEVLGRLADEKGVAMQALAPDGSVSQILANLRETTESMKSLVQEIRAGKGLAGRLATDDELADQVLGNLKAATGNLREITEKLNHGDGTAGAFINDPTLYRDLQDVLHGVQKSKMMSWFIRHYREKGEKERLKDPNNDGNTTAGQGSPEGL
ncbi:MAG TPA: MlaD family protein [Verrucomicrobiae bacterium]|nr:MlaD family protein [Verrucomicrobiae bacterium]